MNMYAVSLHGQGDHYYFLVDQARWDWIHSPKPESKQETIPPEFTNGEHEVVSLNFVDNDRAIALMSHADETFYTLSELCQSILAQGIYVADSFDGEVY